MSRRCPSPLLISLASTVALLLLVGKSTAADWIHWRGPEQNGVSREKNLPGEFDPALKEKGNVIWKQPFGGRSSPLVMAGKLYVIQGVGEGINEGEQVVCFEEKTGKKLWEYRVNVFHTDIVSSRLGWTTLTADPEAGLVYAHTTGGHLLCLDSAGKLVWGRQLTEEFGRVSGYGGRIVSPTFDSGLVIAGMVNANWGDQGRGLTRFAAFDGKTGQVVWWSTPNPDALYGTHTSTPVIAVINGQRLFIAGGADGALHALKVRTGEKVWSYTFGKGFVNGSPIVDGNLVYCNHGESNIEGSPLGRIICVDGSVVDPKTKTPKLVWDTFRRPYKANRNQPLAARFGLASGAVFEGKLFIPDDSGEIHCFRAKDGELLWKYRYAAEVRGSPLIADGKLYVFDVKARIAILTLDGDKRPDDGETFTYRFPGVGGLLTETNGTPIAVNGRVYFNTRTDLFCIGDPAAKPEADPYKPFPAETEYKENAIAGVRIFPADVSLKPGEKFQFQVVYFDANGREVKDNRPSPAGTWSLPLPPKTPAGLQPPALQGTVEDGTFTPAGLPGQHGYLDFASGEFKARARVRVVPQIPYENNFDNLPEGAAPGGWVNAQGKFFAKKVDGNTLLAKVNTSPRPPIARANGYITSPDASNYTIQADLKSISVRNRLGDMGLVNSRYTIVLVGAADPLTHKRQVRVQSWDGRRRIDEGVDFDWASDVWYTVKLVVEQKEKTAHIRAKVWKKGEAEPEKWLLDFEDRNPNRAGAAALYGYVYNVAGSEEGGKIEEGSEIYYDNLTIRPNGMK
jgi:outer membrane protein assembly factor BamB